MKYLFLSQLTADIAFLIAGVVTVSEMVTGQPHNCFFLTSNGIFIFLWPKTLLKLP